MPADSSSPTPPSIPSGLPTPDGTAPKPETAEHLVPRHERPHVEEHPKGKRLAFLTLTALGVVFGDIGTSPLYAFKECFKPDYGLTPTPENVYGVLSLILWSLILVVSFKYIVFIMRADNRGEGGIVAMLALILKKDSEYRRGRFVLISLGLFGAALLYGDGVITPAISVLSAIEGLTVHNEDLASLVVPITVVIIVGLFAVQRHGTTRVGSAFGPLMALWFIAIGGLGLVQVLRDASVLWAINPIWAVRFFQHHDLHAMVVLGAVVLAVTGAEALYADMGHFGKKPIRTAWFWMVFPALLLNYFGQGSLVLGDPAAAENPFYNLAPTYLLLPMVGLATLAAIIASQALISGAFSLTQQCIQLGYSPRLSIVHTSAREFGQIFVPEVNIALGVGTVLVVLGFQSSSHLGAAYGIAVTGTMTVTTLLFFVIAARRWHWPVWRVAVLTLLFLVVDLSFLGANAIKIEHGGWVPVLLAIVLFTLMTTWKRGKLILRERLQEITMPLDAFLKSLSSGKIPRVPGTAVFMASQAAGAPVVLLHHLKHNKVLHEQVILLSISTAEVPEVRDEERVTMERLDHGFVRATATYGFMESPDVTHVLALLRQLGLKARPMETSYYLGRELLIPRQKAWKEGGMTMSIWRKKLFAVMARNAVSAAAFFQLPPNRVVELGTQIEF
ncbi:MAG: potassium transporter Kup [Gemmatimonadaceae bacterium]